MQPVSKQFDENLARLAWSLWTELGVAGLERKHQDFGITPEELIILTSVLSEFDPRLRDEALDWCIQYHRFISPIHLQIIAKKYEPYIATSFSIFSATLNTFTKAKWTLLTEAPPLKIHPSGKSRLRNFETLSMVYFRLRSFFGVSVRADTIAFLLGEKREYFIASDLLEIGYSKSRLAEVLADLALAGVLTESQVRNQLHYSFTRRSELIKLVGGIPKKMVHWDRILAVLIPIRACLQATENSPIGVRAIDIRNLLNHLSRELSLLKLTPPPLQKDLDAYWVSVTEWILEFTRELTV